MKKSVFILACFFLAVKMHAQEFKDFTIAAFVGGQYHWYKNESLIKFVDSYNTNLSSRLKAPIEYLAPKFGLNYGGEIRFSICRIGLMGSRIRAESTANLNNGCERSFKLKMNEIDWYIDLMKPSQKKWRIGITIGSHNQNAVLLSAYKFANGYLSYTKSGDGALSGIYRFRGDYQVSLGLRFERNIAKRVMFVGKLEYAKFGTKVKLLAHKDEMYNNILSGAQYSDGQPALYFPDDYVNSNNLYYNTIGNGCIYGPFQGIRASVQLNIILFKRNEK